MPRRLISTATNSEASAGAPAIAVAMPVQAEARVTTGVAESELRVAGGGSWRFAWQEGVPRWREVPPGGEGRILESVAATLAADGWRRGAGGRTGFGTVVPPGRRV